MLKGDYYPDFTAKMMHKDISLGLDLAKKYDVPSPATEFAARKYEEAMDIYGPESGSSIPCRLVERASGCTLVDSDVDASHPSNNYDGNRVAPESHGGAFRDWSYTTDLYGGSYTIKHTGYNNPYLTPPWTTHAGQDELEKLKARVVELEAALAAANTQ